MTGHESSGNLDSADLDVLRGVLSDHPIRLAVVFGSQVRGDAHSTSDVDLAVEFDDVADDSKADTRSRLVADVASALGRNAVDVADIETMRPAVGRSALEDGIILLGSSERAKRHHDAFEQAETPTEATRGERFDAVLDRVEELV